MNTRLLARLHLSNVHSSCSIPNTSVRAPKARMGVNWANGSRHRALSAAPEISEQQRTRDIA